MVIIKMVNYTYAAEVFQKTFSVPVAFIQADFEVIYDSAERTIHPFYNTVTETYKHIRFDYNSSLPIFTTTPYLEEYFTISFREGTEYAGSLIIGPVQSYLLAEEATLGMWYTSDNKKELYHYYQSIPYMTKNQWLQSSILLYFMLFQKELSISTIYEKNQTYGRDSLINRKRTVDFEKAFHQQENNWLFEQEMLLAIQEGNTKSLEATWEKHITKKRYPYLSISCMFRSNHNIAIAAIMLARTAAIDGGMKIDEVFALSDSYIRELSNITHYQHMQTFIKEVFIEFSKRVATSAFSKYPKAIQSCLAYITEHIFEPISLYSIANALQYNATYLSSLFKKEVGCHLMEYIQKRKVEEAKYLLRLTDSPLSDIYAVLHFTDQSYFTKIFKRFTGMTPKKYRNMY